MKKKMNKITYGLAQQLKDAGFPFFYLLNSENMPNKEGEKFENYIALKHSKPPLLWAEIPTLPELIEACLKKHCVFKLNCWEHGFVISREGEDDMEICEDADVAVAKLYIKLNGTEVVLSEN